MTGIPKYSTANAPKWFPFRNNPNLPQPGRNLRHIIQRTQNSRIISYLLPCILHLLSEHSTQYHLDVLQEGIMPIIIAVQSHLVWVNHIVVVLHGNLLHGSGITRCLPGRYIGILKHTDLAFYMLPLHPISFVDYQSLQ